MSYKRVLLIIFITGICAAGLVYFLIQMEASATKKMAASRPVALPYNWVGNITKSRIAEPSGITYHAARRSLFIADDSGSIHEVRLDGTPVQSKGLSERDIEGITVNPDTGMLYAAVEDDETILELDAETLTIQREFRINRNFEGEQLLKKGGMGIEAIAFVPRCFAPRRRGPSGLAINRLASNRRDEPSVICEVSVSAPLWHSSQGQKVLLLTPTG